MQVESMKIFCDLVEFKSFSRAAEKNLISQSAVSQQLGQFETEFRCQLIDRSKRPFELTETGNLFYETCQDVISRLHKFKSDTNSLSSKSKGRIKIGAIFSIGMHSLQGYIKKFMSRYPSVSVDVDFYKSSQIYHDILSGDIDIGLVAVPRKDKNIELMDFVNEKLVLVCNRDHPFADKFEIDIHELQMQRFISFGYDVPTRDLIDDILKKHSVVVNSAMEFDNTETIKRAVEIGSGVCILPENTIQSEIQSGTLRAINFSNESFYRPTGIIIRKNKVFAESTRYLVELLRQKSIS